MKKQSKALVTTGLLLFLAGGAAWFLLAVVFTSYENLAVPVAAALAALGGLLLILNAVIHPESIPRPDVQPPQINVNIPPNIRSYPKPQAGANTNVPGIVNVEEWPIVSAFKKDSKPLTKRQKIRGTLCCILWLATVAVYLPVSFHMDNFEISWVVFLGTAVVHTLIYGLFSIGERKEG